MNATVFVTFEKLNDKIFGMFPLITLFNSWRIDWLEVCMKNLISMFPWIENDSWKTRQKNENLTNYVEIYVKVIAIAMGAMSILFSNKLS